VTPRAGPTSYLRGTVPISRGKTDATGSSRAESPVHRAEGNGGRIVHGGLVWLPGGNFLPPLGNGCPWLRPLGLGSSGDTRGITLRRPSRLPSVASGSGAHG
jgi:hypothetical protein